MGSDAGNLTNEKDDHIHHRTAHVTEKDVDVAARLAFTPGKELDPAEALRVRRKIDWHIMPMMCWSNSWIRQRWGAQPFVIARLFGLKIIYKLTGYSAYRTDAQLTANDNWLSTVFYISYLIFEYPQSLALQRFPVGKWMSINIFIWAVALCAHAACNNFGGLFAVRFILGICEGSITAGFMIVTSMFYTRAEQSKRTGYWFLMNGSALIASGFLSFGVLHIKKGALHPWQWLMLITGIVTLVLAVCFWLFFPDSPANARFLTHEERKIAVERIKVNQTGVENKHFKREQFIEALKDPKTWIFALFAAVQNIPNALSNQGQIIITSFGFTPINTTLLTCVFGVLEIAAIWSGVTVAGRYKNARAYVGIISFIPNILGGILEIALPLRDKVGLLFGIWMQVVGVTGYALALGWVTAVTAGHTKRVTVNAIILTAYAAGNIAGPQMFQAKYAPRNRVPWIVIIVCNIICPLLLLWIRFILSRENKRRDAGAERSSADSGDVAYIVEILEDGTKIDRTVDKAFLDLTDIQNKDFRYVL